MIFRREAVDVFNIKDTKTVVLSVEYSGDLDGPADIALLLGDAWHEYVVDSKVTDPSKLMSLIHKTKGSKPL